MPELKELKLDVNITGTSIEALKDLLAKQQEIVDKMNELTVQQQQTLSTTVDEFKKLKITIGGN